MADTGFTPQWVELQKEIRLQTEALRQELGKFRLVGFSDLKDIVSLIVQIKLIY